MQRRQPDANPGALHVAGTLTGDSVDVIVISTDEALIATLQQAAGADHTLWHAPSIDAAVELLVGGHCGILIADMQVLRGEAAAALEKLQSQFPELVLLATGRRDEEGRVAGLISRGSVYRFLHKPVSPARANLFLATATRRYHELAQNVSPALASVRELTKPAHRVPLIGAGAGALLLIVGAVIFLSRREPAVETLPTPASVATQPVATPALDTTPTLAAAQAAFSAGKLSAPSGDNALERYRAVLTVEPANAAALAGVQDVLDALETQVTQALQAGDAAAAARAFTTLQKAQPDHPELPTLNAQLLALSRSVRQAPAKAPAVSAPTAPAAPNTQLARSRIAAGQLLEPEDDSAVFHLRAARDLGEDDTVNRILATDVGSRLLAQTRQAMANEDMAQARTQFAAAAALDREFELALPDLPQVEQELNALTTAATRAVIDEQLAPIIKLRENGRLIEPAGDNAFERLQTLAEQSPDAAAVRTEQQRLAFTLLDHARTALAQGDLERAGLLTNRAETLVPRMTNARTLRDQIAAAQEERDAANRVVQARELPRTREVAAAYPNDAERRGIEGWVDIEFVIATDGTTRSPIVRESQPAGVFDKSALDALAKWRFEPVTRNGKTVEQRAILRVRFALK
ncbi:MAG TPA: TonB family protein [Povalibacter sp.]|uniref:TonB family protein n=1 Tax=Povalibacter sp. TaxID=1962978 RepID=UPI002C7B0F35|nr:TonB family protein [Povalibacter sp.]HMN43544.1 TonB family protein [Povalibacter sp.]